MQTLRELGKPGDLYFSSDGVATVLRELWVDFLLRFKDKHPFSNPEEGEVMDIHDMIMDFIYDYDFRPSEALFEEYSHSELTMLLNEFPPYEYLNERFECGMKIDAYERMKKRYESKPPFVYFFNPNFKLKERIDHSNGWLEVGFFSKSEVKIIKISLTFHTIVDTNN